MSAPKFREGDVVCVPGGAEHRVNSLGVMFERPVLYVNGKLAGYFVDNGEFALLRRPVQVGDELRSRADPNLRTRVDRAGIHLSAVEHWEHADGTPIDAPGVSFSLALPPPFEDAGEISAERLMPRTPAGRLEFLNDLYAPMVERDNGTMERDPSLGVISREQVARLMDLPDIADELDGSNAHTDLCECPSCKPSVCSECRASAPAYAYLDGKPLCTPCADRKEPVKAESGSNFPPSASTTRSASGDVVEFHFRLGELHGAVAIDGRLMRHLGEKGQMGLDVMATEVRGMLDGYFSKEPPLTVERLALAEWRVDPEVSAYIDEASEYEDRIAAGALSAEADAHREQVAAIAWTRREPAGSRERAEQRAEAVLDRLRGTR